MLAFDPSAISEVSDHFVHVEKQRDRWFEPVEAGHLVTMNGHRLSHESGPYELEVGIRIETVGGESKLVRDILQTCRTIRRSSRSHLDADRCEVNARLIM